MGGGEVRVAGSSKGVSPRLRNEIAASTYHVVARGVDRRRIFVDDEDYETYTRLLRIVTERQGWHLLAYCLMPNHVHLMIETPETNLANGMQWLHSRYALAFNERYERKGHLFEAPYKSGRIETDEQFVSCVGYIVVNPVAAALSKKAEDWPWGSHPATVADNQVRQWHAHARLVDRLEASTGLRCYAELVAAREQLLADDRRRAQAAAERRALSQGIGRPLEPASRSQLPRAA